MRPSPEMRDLPPGAPSAPSGEPPGGPPGEPPGEPGGSLPVAPSEASEASEASLRPQSRVTRAAASLRQRNFRLYWSGQMVSVMGTWMQGVGQAWLVLQLSHSAFQLGLVGALQLTPTLLFTLFAGVLTDRWPKRRILLVTQSAALLQALALWALVVSGNIHLWQVYVLATLLGLTNLDMPTRQAFVVEMVGREDLPNAVALNSSIANLGRIVGPAIGGLIIATRGVAPLFLLNALSYLAVIIALALINPRALHISSGVVAVARGQQRIWASLREGLAFVWRTPAVSLVMVVVGAAVLFGSNFNVLLPLLATQTLGAGAAGYGFLSAAMGAGSLLAALALAASNLRPTFRRVLLVVVCFGLLELGLAASRSFPVSAVLVVAVALAETTFATFGITIVQTATPNALLGRVMSVNILFLDGTVPPGYLLMGALASGVGAPGALAIGAAGALLVAGAGWLGRKPAERAERAK